MGSIDENEELNTDKIRAENALTEIQSFIEVVDDRGALSALKRILEGDTFEGGYVGQAPEYFTERYLIEPLLEALGYTDPIGQPVDLVKDERRRPDFRLEGIHPQCVCIVESKRLNEEQHSNAATNDIINYLQDDTFVKYAKDHRVQYLLGVATDGLDWTLHAKDLQTGTQTRIVTESIRDVVQTVNTNYTAETVPPERWWSDTRNIVRSNLVNEFSIENIFGTAKSELYEK